MAVPKKKKSKKQDPKPSRRCVEAGGPRPQRLPPLRCGQAPHTVCPTCGWYKGRVAVDVNA